MVTTLTRDPASLGAALTNVRTPIANELSAVNVEVMKTALIDHAAAINLHDHAIIGGSGSLGAHSSGISSSSRQSTGTYEVLFTSAVGGTFSCDVTINGGAGFGACCWETNGADTGVIVHTYATDSASAANYGFSISVHRGLA